MAAVYRMRLLGAHCVRKRRALVHAIEPRPYLITLDTRLRVVLLGFLPQFRLRLPCFHLFYSRLDHPCLIREYHGSNETERRPLGRPYEVYACVPFGYLRVSR